MKGWQYEHFYILMVSIFALWIGVRRLISKDYSCQEKGSPWVIPLTLCILFSFWLGLRPIHPAFGDTVNYAIEYQMLDSVGVGFSWSSEWVWRWLMVSCKTAGLSVNSFFLVVELIYVLTAFLAVWKFMPSDTMLGMVFVMGSLMFYTFGVNGLRNGIACHVVLLAISLLLDDRYVLGIILSLIAFGLHRSTILPTTAALVGIFVVRDFRYALAFWIFSILVSLVAGDMVSNFFAGLGFDDRMASYAESRNMSVFSREGFRWDFLLYSAMPIVMGWYICIKRNIQDNWYNVICMVYCLANAFWVMVIRSAYSNRFAYLSWFIYPIVIAYPLVNLPVWEDQDRKTGLILLAYVAFTAFMLEVVW